MDFTVYTAGSVDFLEIMLNATAMITGSGEAEDIAKIGALLGLLLIAFQAVFNNQPIAFQKPILLLIMYALFFGPTSTVVIEDTASNQIKVVDNVPLGPAFIGSTISTISYRIANVMEQATSTPGMTEYGLFNSLYTMSAVRDTLRNPTSNDAFNNYGRDTGQDLPKTFNNHMTLCVGNPTELENTSIDERKRSSNAASTDILGAIHSDRDSQYIPVYDGTAGFGIPAMKTCRESSLYIAAAMRNVLPAMLDEVLVKGFSTDASQGRMLNGGAVLLRVQEAIDSYAITGKSAQDYVITSAIITSFENGRADALQHWHGARAAVALRDSLNQQEIQWAGRGDVFKHYMKPMIAFFEGLLYGITPFMAFAMLLGGAGVSILGKYMILPIAIGMWMPLLSIVNAFTLWYAGAQIEPIMNAYDASSSGFAISQIQDLDHAISKALGVGGLLAASVPALALFIVSGSAYVANSIMSNMTSGDKFRSEDVTPRVQNSSPALATTAMYTSDQTTGGASLTGSREKSVQVSGGFAAEASVSSATMLKESAMTGFTETAGTAFNQALQTSEGRDLVSGLGRSQIQSLDLSNDASFQQSANTLRQLGFSETQIESGVSTASTGLGFSLGFTMGKRLDDSEQFQNMSSEQQAQARQAISSLNQTVSNRTTDADKLDTAERFSEGLTATTGVTDTESLSKSISTAREASDIYQTANNNKSQLAAQQSLDLKQVSSNSLRNGGTANGLTSGDAAYAAQERFFSSPEERAMVAQNMARLQQDGLTTDQNELKMAAVAQTLLQQGRFGELVNSEFNPFNLSPSVGDANANSGMADRQPAQSFEGMQGRFEGARSSNLESINNNGLEGGRAELENRGIERLEQSRVDNSAPVESFYESGQAYIDDKEREMQSVDLERVGSSQPIENYANDSSQAFGAANRSMKNSIADAKDSIVNFFTGRESTPPAPSEETYRDPVTGDSIQRPSGMDADVPFVPDAPAYQPPPPRAPAPSVNSIPVERSGSQPQASADSPREGSAPTVATAEAGGAGTNIGAPVAPAVAATEAGAPVAPAVAATSYQQPTDYQPSNATKRVPTFDSIGSAANIASTTQQVQPSNPRPSLNSSSDLVASKSNQTPTDSRRAPNINA